MHHMDHSGAERQTSKVILMTSKKDTEDKVTSITEENMWLDCVPWPSGKQNWQAEYLYI